MLLKKVAISLALILIFPVALFAQKIKLLNSTQQDWSGGTVGRHGSYYKFNISFSQFSGQIKPDTIWLGQDPYASSSANPWRSASAPSSMRRIAPRPNACWIRRSSSGARRRPNWRPGRRRIFPRASRCSAIHRPTVHGYAPPTVLNASTANSSAEPAWPPYSPIRLHACAWFRLCSPSATRIG